MLLQFSVQNYRSFKDLATLSMEASTYKENRGGAIFSAGKYELLKSAGLYGANASGKSNLLMGLLFLKNFVTNSSKEGQATDLIPVFPFKLDTATENEPSHFEVIFLQSGIRYRYGFQVTQSLVKSEWLFYTPKTKEVELFIRNEGKYKLGTSFKEGKNLENRTRSNALFLSVVTQFNGAISQQVLLWINQLNVVSGLNDDAYVNFTIDKLKEDSSNKDALLNLLRVADLGIDELETTIEELKPENLPPIFSPEMMKQMFESGNARNLMVRTLHKKFDHEKKQYGMEAFDLTAFESEGTKKMFFLGLPILDALKKGKVLVVDELDARLHPLITEYLVKLFNSAETNPNNAQLIFTTHDTNLLDTEVFRRDQIWFTQKNKFGASELYSLVEYNPRNDAAYDKNYLLGKYGATPLVASSENL